jgi:hypothetical protein
MMKINGAKRPVRLIGTDPVIRHAIIYTIIPMTICGDLVRTYLDFVNSPKLSGEGIKTIIMKRRGPDTKPIFFSSSG